MGHRCGERPGQYCNLSLLNHTLAAGVATAKLVKAIILIRGGAEEPNMLPEWAACRHAVQEEVVKKELWGGHAVY